MGGWCSSPSLVVCRASCPPSPTAPSLLFAFVLPVRLVSCDAPCLLDVMHPPPNVHAHAHAHAHAHIHACADLHLRSPGRSAWHHQGGCCQDCGANVAVGQRAVVCVVGGGRMVGEGGAYPGKDGLEAQCPSVAFCEHCPHSVHGATTPATSLLCVWCGRYLLGGGVTCVSSVGSVGSNPVRGHLAPCHVGMGEQGLLGGERLGARAP